MSVQPVPILNTPIQPVLNTPQDPLQNSPTSVFPTEGTETSPIITTILSFPNPSILPNEGAQASPISSSVPSGTSPLEPASSPTEMLAKNSAKSNNNDNTRRQNSNDSEIIQKVSKPTPSVYPKAKTTKSLPQNSGLSTSTKTGLIAGTISSVILLILIALLIKYKFKSKKSNKQNKVEFGEGLYDNNNFIPRTMYTEDSQSDRNLNTTINSSNAFQSSTNPFESQKFMFGGNEIKKYNNVENESEYNDSLARLNTLKNANLNSISSYESERTGINGTSICSSSIRGGKPKSYKNTYTNSFSSVLTPIDDSLYADSIYQDSSHHSVYSVQDTTQYSESPSNELKEGYSSSQHSIYHNSPYSAF